MKTTLLASIVLLAMIYSVIAGENENLFLNQTMVPLVRQFVKQNRLAETNLSTNDIIKYRVTFFKEERSGCLANLKLKCGYFFDVWSDGTNAEVRDFGDANVRTYYNLSDAPKEKIEAVKKLNLSNKLNEKTALELAEKFFELQGHKKSNFHSPEIHQCNWVGTDAEGWGPLPYYQIKWYRKDVTQTERESGLSTVPEIVIEVSGVTSNLVAYHKYGSLPIGKDF
ncbi:MAG TPA: hypothetical protein VFM25_15590 [Verrucomicrobiae bacterium]|nr:hypothetical protein [Verrucomicrobiae bacterium]